MEFSDPILRLCLLSSEFEFTLCLLLFFLLLIVFTCILLFTFPPPTALLLSSYLVFINDALDLLVVLLDILIFEGNTTDYD